MIKHLPDYIHRIFHIREVLNISILKEKYHYNNDMRNQLWVSCDVIEDTFLGLDYYLNNQNDNENIGQRYLYIYGFLQMLFVQQDAIKNMAESIGLSIEFSTAIMQIRSVRNDIIGHPTKRDKNGKRKKYKEKNLLDYEYCVIHRSEIYTESVTYYKWKNNGLDMCEIDLEEFIIFQSQWVEEQLEHIFIFIKTEWEEMKHMLQQKKLADILMGYDYKMEKMLSVNDQINYSFGYETLFKQYQDIKAEIFSRFNGCIYRTDIKDLFGKIDYLFKFICEVYKHIRQYDQYELDLHCEMFLIKFKELYNLCVQYDAEVDNLIDEEFKK